MLDKGISRSDLREEIKEENTLIPEFGRQRSIRSISRSHSKQSWLDWEVVLQHL